MSLAVEEEALPGLVSELLGALEDVGGRALGGAVLVGQFARATRLDLEDTGDELMTVSEGGVCVWGGGHNRRWAQVTCVRCPNTRQLLGAVLVCCTLRVSGGLVHTLFRLGSRNLVGWSCNIDKSWGLVLRKKHRVLAKWDAGRCVFLWQVMANLSFERPRLHL